MICAGSEPKRRAALAKVLPLQRAEFEELLEGMGELPVTIRLFDPPLLEFMPRDEEDQAALAATLGMPISALRSRIAELTELNPMLGLRGCRLSVRYPEITEMQVRAILEAAAAVMARTGKKVRPEIMVPLVSYRAEYDLVAGIIRRVADEVEVESKVKLAYLIGTMIELPRTALRAGEIARGEDGADFFSFGTNDLTQTCLGLSRDDAAPILAGYASAGLFAYDPFVSIDQSRRR